MDHERDAFLVPPEVSYFNTANLAPQLRRVREAGIDALARRGAPWEIAATDWFDEVERLRSAFGELIGADAEGTALIPATSYGFAVAAANLPLRTGDRILVLAEEYPSGIYTWRRAARETGAEVVTVSRRPGEGWTEAVLGQLDDRVVVVSVPNVHWTDGALVDLATIGARAHEVGARLVIDASQSVGAIPLDVGDLRPDYVISVGYKWLLGPFGLGYLYVAPEHRGGRPLEENWIGRAGSEDFARLIDYRDDYQPGARRFDVGERTNFELTPMALAALTQLGKWGVAAVGDRLARVTDAVADGVVQLGLEPLPADKRGPHILGIELPAPIRAGVLAVLSESGCFAAVRGASLRISPHLHVTDEDIERLLGALARAV